MGSCLNLRMENLNWFYSVVVSKNMLNFEANMAAHWRIVLSLQVSPRIQQRWALFLLPGNDTSLHESHCGNIRLHSACLSLKTTIPERENRNKDRQKCHGGYVMCLFSCPAGPEQLTSWAPGSWFVWTRCREMSVQPGRQQGGREKPGPRLGEQLLLWHPTLWAWLGGTPLWHHPRHIKLGMSKNCPR